MVDQTKIFDLNVHMHEGFDCNDAHLESGNLVKYSRPIVRLISMLSKPSTSKSITMPSDLDEEVEIAREVLKVQFILNQKTLIPHRKLSFPEQFFVVNDGSKPNLILPQIMHYVICHFVCQNYSVSSTIRRKKGMGFNNQHEIISMKNQSLCFRIASKWFNMPSLHWWLRPWNNMQFPFQIHVLQQQCLLIYGSPNLDMTHLFLWLI